MMLLDPANLSAICRISGRMLRVRAVTQTAPTFTDSRRQRNGNR
jgi:hypothetical protein